MVEYTDPSPATMPFDPARVKPIIGSLADQWLKHGWREGMLEGIELALDIKFGMAGLSLLPELREIKDPGRLDAVKRVLKTARTPDEVRQVYQGASG